MTIYSLTNPALNEYFGVNLMKEFFEVFISDKDDYLFATSLGFTVIFNNIGILFTNEES